MARLLVGSHGWPLPRLFISLMLIAIFETGKYKMPSTVEQAKHATAPFVVLFVILITVVGPLYLSIWSLDLFLCWMFDLVLSAIEWCNSQWTSYARIAEEWNLDIAPLTEQTQQDEVLPIDPERDESTFPNFDFGFPNPQNAVDEAGSSSTLSFTSQQQCAPYRQEENHKSTRPDTLLPPYCVLKVDADDLHDNPATGYMPVVSMADYEADSSSSSRLLEIQYKAADQGSLLYRRARRVNSTQKPRLVEIPPPTSSTDELDAESCSNSISSADPGLRREDGLVIVNTLHRCPRWYPLREPEPHPPAAAAAAAPPPPPPAVHLLSNSRVHEAASIQRYNPPQPPRDPLRNRIRNTLLRPSTWTQKLSPKRRAQLATSKALSAIVSATKKDLSRATAQIPSRKRLRIYVCWSKTKCSNPARCRRHRQLVREAPPTTAAPPRPCESRGVLTPVPSYRLPSPVLSQSGGIGIAVSPGLDIDDFHDRKGGRGSTPASSVSPLPSTYTLRQTPPRLPPRCNNNPAIPERTTSLNDRHQYPSYVQPSKTGSQAPAKALILRGGADNPNPRTPGLQQPHPIHSHGRRPRHRRRERVPDNIVVSPLTWWLAGGRALARESAPITVGYLRDWRKRSDTIDSERARERGQAFVHGPSGRRWGIGRAFRSRVGTGGESVYSHDVEEADGTRRPVRKKKRGGICVVM